MPNPSTYLPQSGSYTLSWATLSNYGSPSVVSPTSSGVSTITYTPGSMKITQPNGVTSTYTYNSATIFWASQLGNQMLMFQADDGTYVILSDPNGFLKDLGSYTYQLNTAGTLLVDGGNNGTLLKNWASTWVAECFLTGTMISTPSGHVAVEDIKPGMEVLTFDKSGNSVVKKVQWVGREQVNNFCPTFNMEKAPLRFNFQPVFYMEKVPVRIKKDAISANVPFKDCLVTPEHCLFVNGCFVPARMLVNDKSIYYDRSLVEYEYFHVELEDHSILQSDGLFSESYLKTSDRDFSSYEGRTSTEDKTWEHDAAAQLKVDRNFVEPLYQQFAQRAEELQFPAMERKIVTTSKIYMMDQEGNKIYASKVSENKHLFHIKGRSDSVFIRSDSSQPSESVGSFVDDRRQLGLLIGEINLLTSNNVLPYTKHLEDRQLFGWHDGVVSDYARWTNGNAQLLDLGMKGDYFISIEVLDQLPSIRRVAMIEDTTEITAVA